MGPAMRKSRTYQTTPLSLRIRPYCPSISTTPRSSLNAMTTTIDVATTQPGTTTENNIFNQPPSAITRIHAAEGAAITKAGETLDRHAKNWSSWSQSMALLFKLFKVQEYVLGKIVCPDPKDDTQSAENWTYNDTFAQLLITSNISPAERVHTNSCPTANRM